MIIQALHERQDARGGYLTDGDMKDVANVCGVPLHRVQSLISFFPHFRTDKPPKVSVHICRDMSCHLRGSLELIDEVSEMADARHGKDVEVCGVSCLGRCDRAPAAMINEHLYVKRDRKELSAIVDSIMAGRPVDHDSDLEYAQEVAETWKMDVYLGSDSEYESIRNYVTKTRPNDVLNALEKAGLLGMGGAGGRAYKKWGDVLKAKGDRKYIVCNADESEPGTFKDRDILLRTPHLVIEGMILGGLVVGAQRGWLYIRHEYHEQVACFNAELQRAREMGALGRNIFGSGRSFDLEVFVSPGGYICGEQTALIEAMEDKRAEPRNRPPELMTNGYKDRPTLLSNVETFAWVPAIILRSAGRWFAAQGNKKAEFAVKDGKGMNGVRLFSISGDVKRPGVYEVPTGITLGDLIEKHCLGMADGQQLAGVALSGPSGGILPRQIPVEFLNQDFVLTKVPAGVKSIDVLDVPLDIQVSRALGIMIGAGLVVYGDRANIPKEALACSRFFRNESCGKCVPCRIGSQKITEMGESIVSGKVSSSELPVLQETALELAQVMNATSICGLGQVASNPIRSLLNYFPEEIEQLAQNRGRRQ